MKALFPIIGMHCASCAKLIERQLKKTPGVTDASVNYGSEVAVVEFDDSACNLQTIAQSVESAGYKAVVVNEQNKKPEDIKNNPYFLPNLT